MIDFIDSPEPGSRRPFSRATKAAGLVFVSGSSAPHDPARGIYRGDTAAEQVRHSLGYIADVLRTAGSGLDRVVQITMLITDPADHDACNADYVKHFPIDNIRTRRVWRTTIHNGRTVGVGRTNQGIRTARSPTISQMIFAAEV